MKIPHAYVITLVEKKKLAVKRAEHFEERGLSEYTFYTGLHAEMLGVRTIWTYDVDNPGTEVYLGVKQVGIWLSHFSLWSALTLVEGPRDHFLIMENDVELPEDWRARMEQALDDAPADFDMLYMGSCCCAGHPMDHIKGEVYQITGGFGPQCLHAYVVARKALPTLLRTQKRLYAPIDCSLVFHSHPLLKVYVVLPSIASQDGNVIPP